MPISLSRILSTFEPLRNRNLKRYIVAQMVSMIGTWMQNTGIAWLVWELSRSPAALGTVGMLGMLPFLFLAPWTGGFADRVNRRRLLLTTQSAAMVLAFILALLVQCGSAQLWQVYLLALLFGCEAALDLPTHHAFLADLSGVGDVRKALLINNIVLQSSRLIGPMIAGFLISGVGLAATFWLNGLSFLTVVWTLTRISSSQAPAPPRKTSFHDFAEGLRFVKGSLRIQFLFVFSAFISFLAFSSNQMLAAYADNVLHRGAGALGLLMGASGLGAFFGSLVVTPQVHHSRRIGWILPGACIWTGLCFQFVAGSNSLSLSLVAIALGSVTMPVVMTTSNALLQYFAGEGMRARLASLWLMVVFGTQPVAMFLLGYYAKAVGVASTIGLCGAILILGPLVLLMGSPELRSWDNPQSHGVSP